MKAQNGNDSFLLVEVGDLYFFCIILYYYFSSLSCKTLKKNYVRKESYREKVFVDTKLSPRDHAPEEYFVISAFSYRVPVSENKH